ncbi:MAG: nonstructural protein [Microvirus sp.]|nr:MAG: nonstructural protein [Microvirus sp.]
MRLKAFALLDTKVSAFHTPFFMAHTGHAIRACGELGADLSTTVGRHPADFILYEIGEFDDSRGSLLPHDLPINLGPVLAFIPQRSPSATPLLDVLPEQGPAVTVPLRNGYAPSNREGTV